MSDLFSMRIRSSLFLLVVGFHIYSRFWHPESKLESVLTHWIRVCDEIGYFLTDSTSLYFFLNNCQPCQNKKYCRMTSGHIHLIMIPHFLKHISDQLSKAIGVYLEWFGSYYISLRIIKKTVYCLSPRNRRLISCRSCRITLFAWFTSEPIYFPDHNLFWLGVYFRLVCLSVCLFPR